jgi:thiol:disulfide interchange protein
MRPLLVSLALLVVVAGAGVIFAILFPPDVAPISDPLPWVSDLDVALARAHAEAKPVFLYLYADWCGVCRKMEAETFSDPAVRERLDAFVLLKVDSDRDTEVAARYGTAFLPTLALLDANGEARWRGAGFHSPAELLTVFE